jgi:hypothetical protein
MFVPLSFSPKSAAAVTSTKTPNPNAPSTIRRICRGTGTHSRQRACASSGRFQSAPSATNERTRTIAPP